MGITPLWTYHLTSAACACPDCVRRRNQLLSTVEAVPDKQLSKSRKGTKSCKPNKQASEGVCYDPFLLRAVRKSPLFFFKDFTAPAALAFRAGITFTFYDTFMQRGHPYNGGVIPRQGFLWGFISGATGQCLAHMVWALFDRTAKDDGVRLLPLVAISAGVRFGIYTVLKFLYLPVVLCKVADPKTVLGTDNFWMGQTVCSAVPQVEVARYPGWSHMNVVQDLNWVDLFLGTVYE